MQATINGCSRYQSWRFGVYLNQFDKFISSLRLQKSLYGLYYTEKSE